MNKIRARSVLLALAVTTVLAVPARADLFGPSDDEIAAERAHEDGQDSRTTELENRIGALNNRVRDLEESLRQSTGRNEALDNRISQISQQMDRQQRDFEYRLCIVTAKQLGASTDPGAGGINCAAAAAPAQPALQQTARLPGGAVPLQAPPGTLGTLPAAGVRGGQRGFDGAMNSLARGQMDEASATFRAFADANPDDDDLAPQAVYWVGIIAYNQNDYAKAGRNFLEVVKKYPKSPRGPESMLKLGQSLIAMGQKNEACTTLGAIKKQYPATPQDILDKAGVERRNAACK